MVITSLGRESGGGLVVSTDAFMIVHRASYIAGSPKQCTGSLSDIHLCQRRQSAVLRT
jgi:hypothetical protein